MPRPLLLVAALASACLAADQAPPVVAPPPAKPVPAAETAPVPPAARDGAQIADLRAKLPQAAWIAERDGKLWWQAGGKSVAITGIDERQDPQVEAACGTVTVQRLLLVDERADALAALEAEAALAKAAKLSGLRLAEGPLTGIHLRNPDAVVLPDGVLTKADAPAGDRAAEVAAVHAAVDVLKAELTKLGMDGPAQRCTGAVLDKLPSADKGGEIDDATPEYLRRVVRSGWLKQFFPTTDLDDKVEQAVIAAERPTPVRMWKGPSGLLAEVRDAFGRSGWVLRSPSRSAWLVEHAAPIYFNSMPALIEVVELAPGSDPLAADAASAVRSARLWRLAEGDYLPLAAWSPGKPLACAQADWERAVPRRGRPPSVEGWFPPNMLVTTLQGDVIALATDSGTVTPPKNASAAEGERFLAEAARALPDAAHLDLIGEYLLRYVYDSPDPTRPALIGNKQDKGDIHQTALQTTARTAGGMFCGDCDDLAELYETIADRQGRTAHVITLPSHAACAWAEKKAESWHVCLLQTGPALEFIDADLKQALAKTYKHFDDSETFDPNGLGLLLRFSGENLRGQWRLSYRIFEDPEYSRIMIDVQKDWHFSTYQRGIAKMQKLIASNETEGRETANYRELSGLYSFTGQYALAAEFHQKAIDLTQGQPLSALYMDVELVGHLFDAGADHKAREVAIDLIEKQFPAHAKELGPSLMQVGPDLASTLAAHGARDLALRALRPAMALLDSTILETLGHKAPGGKADPAGNPVAGLTALGEWLEGPEFNAELWENHPKLQQFRRLSGMIAGTAIRVLEGTSPADRAGDADLQTAARFTQVWLDRIAFRDADEPGEALFRFAMAGKAYEALLGEAQFAALMDTAPKPAALDSVPARRVGGIAQVALDAGWVRLSAPYWSEKLMRRFERDRDAFDPKLALADVQRAVDAATAIRGTPLEHPRIALQTHLAKVIGAVIARDEAGLRACLKKVREEKDKDYLDDTAQWLGDAARRVPLDWFATVLKAWDQEIGDAGKQKYFWIAWRAALGKAPGHALLAAKLAAERFGNEDPAFVEEYQFMNGLLAPKDGKPKDAKAK